MAPVRSQRDLFSRTWLLPLLRMSAGSRQPGPACVHSQLPAQLTSETDTDSSGSITSLYTTSCPSTDTSCSGQQQRHHAGTWAQAAARMPKLKHRELRPPLARV